MRLRFKKEKKEMVEQIKMAPPWVQYVNELNALFGEDPEINVEYDNDKHEVMLYVNNKSKAEALKELLPAKVEFGNVTLCIMIVVADKAKSLPELYRVAFEGNPAFSDVVTISEAFANPITYVIFQKKVVQYYNDDMSDAHGNRNTLYQELAKDVFDKKDGIFFCTDIK